MEPQMIEAVIERTSEPFDPSRRNGSVYGVGRLVGRGASDSGSNGGRRVLMKLENPGRSDVLLDANRCVVIPPALGTAVALLAPPLGLALWLWDRLRLELGECAVYTDGDAFAPLVGQVALWRGGCPVVRLATEADRDPTPEIDVLLAADADATARELRERIKQKPGFAAIDLSGRPEIIDVFFEVMPRWGRLMLAGPSRAALTVDFYNNVHRKGVLLLTGLFEPTRVFQEEWGAAYLDSAFRILQRKEMAERCARLIEGTLPGQG